MSVIHLWRGSHGPEFAALFARCWAARELLVACPPDTLDLAFVAGLPPGDVRLAGSWPRDARVPTEVRRHAYPDAPLLGVFTSGTSGAGRAGGLGDAAWDSRAAPRLVLYSRANIAASHDAIFALYDAARIDTVFCYPQPYHVFGLLLGFALAQTHGLAVAFADGPYGRRHHAQWLAQPSGALLTLATPSHMLDLCAYLADAGAVPRPTYSCILGGAKVDRRVWEAARAVARIEQPSVGYGCTEASPGICHLPPGTTPAVDGDLGWPLPHTQLDFAVADGFVLRGPGVCLAIIEDGRPRFPTAHHVPDALRLLADGRLVFESRRDVVLNRGGEKFALERIEAVLKDRHDLDAICVAVPDARLGSELGIVVRGRGELSDAAIYASLAAVFHRQFSRAHFRVVAELPLSPSAKPDRRAAGELFREAALAPGRER